MHSLQRNLCSFTDAGCFALSIFIVLRDHTSLSFLLPALWQWEQWKTFSSPFMTSESTQSDLRWLETRWPARGSACEACTSGGGQDCRRHLFASRKLEPKWSQTATDEACAHALRGLPYFQGAHIRYGPHVPCILEEVPVWSRDDFRRSSR